MSMSETQLERFIRSFESMAESLERLSNPIVFYNRSGSTSLPIFGSNIQEQPVDSQFGRPHTNAESPPAPAPATAPNANDPDPEGTTNCV